jgi:hypothetical protein
MDRFVLTCRCLKCGVEVTEPARWYHVHSMLCSCGGQYDSMPFEDTKMFLKGLRDSLPQTVSIVPYIHEDC